METTQDTINNDDLNQSQNEQLRLHSSAMYYSNRMAYDPQNSRKVIGTYSATGEVIPFNIFPNKV